MASREIFLKGEIEMLKKYWMLVMIIVHILLRWMMKKD